MVIDFLTYKYQGKKIDPQAYGLAMGKTIDDAIRDDLMVGATISRAIRAAELRAMEKKS